jgi:WD40 repeat protein
MKRWTGHKSTIWSVAFMAEGKVLVSGGEDGVVKSWDVSSLQSGGEPVGTEILKCEDSVCLYLSSFFHDK